LEKSKRKRQLTDSGEPGPVVTRDFILGRSRLERKKPSTKDKVRDQPGPWRIVFNNTKYEKLKLKEIPFLCHKKNPCLKDRFFLWKVAQEWLESLLLFFIFLIQTTTNYLSTLDAKLDSNRQRGSL